MVSLVALLLLSHGLLPGFGSLSEELLLALFSFLLSSLFLSGRSTVIVDLVLDFDLLIDDLGGFSLQTIGYVLERLKVSSDFDLGELSLDLLFELLATHFILLDFEGDVRDDQSDDNFDGNDHVLEHNCQDDDIAKRPLRRILLLKILNKSRLFFLQESIEVLRGTNWDTWEATYDQNESIARDRKVRNKAHDRHPIANSIRTLRYIPSAELPHMLQLDADLEQIGQEGEEGCEWECHCEEGHKAKLDDRFVVVVD